MAVYQVPPATNTFVLTPTPDVGDHEEYELDTFPYEHHLVEALHEVTLFDLHEAVACDEHGRLNHSEIDLGTTRRSRRTRSSSSNALTCPGRLRAGRVAELGDGAARCKLVACVVRRHGGRLPEKMNGYWWATDRPRTAFMG